MEKEEIELRKAFYDLEKIYRPYFDVLTENQDRYPEYKGAVTLNGYLNYQPDVLFLAYNPAHGKYRDYDKDGAHLVYAGERPFGFFEKGNSRKNGAWWETNKAINHTFYANIIEFLYQYEKELGFDSEYSTHRRPAWSKGIENRIMIMNIYPIATQNGKALKILFGKMVTNKAIPEIEMCKEEWDVRKLFIHPLHQFIEHFVKPKSILCLGKETISDYTWGKSKEHEKGIFVAEDYPNIVGISRSGTWKYRAKTSAKLIADIVKQYNG